MNTFTLIQKAIIERRPDLKAEVIKSIALKLQLVLESYRFEDEVIETKSDDIIYFDNDRSALLSYHFIECERKNNAVVFKLHPDYNYLKYPQA
ncbi:MAG: hypothetical protein ACO1PI_05590 [Bacteroidota bacterium]